MRAFPPAAWCSTLVMLAGCYLSNLQQEEPAARDCDTRLAFYEDADGDGYGNELSVALACAAAEGWVEAAGDCDDTDATLASDCTVDTGPDTSPDTGPDTSPDTGDTDTNDTAPVDTGDTSAVDTGTQDTSTTGTDTSAPPRAAQRPRDTSPRGAEDLSPTQSC